MTSLFRGKDDGTTARLVRMLEDGLLLRHGLARIAVGADGSVMYRIVGSETEIPGRQRVVPLPWIEGVISATLGAQASMVPPVRQVTLRVQLLRTAGWGVVWMAGRFWDHTDGLLPGDWSNTRETLTDAEAVPITIAAISRRLLRAAGERAFEPG
jgi:hypothetical protein